MSSATKEAGRIVRIVQNDYLGANEEDGISYVVAVPLVSPRREELWKDSETLSSPQHVSFPMQS